MFEQIKKYRYKIDTHCHSNPASGCSNFTPEEVVKKYIEQGFDGIVLTNHFYTNDAFRNDKTGYISRWLDDYEKAKQVGDELGIRVYLGMEIRFANVNNNDYLVYGIDTADVRRAADYLEGDIETFYREFKNEKNVIVQAHPFRKGITVVEPKHLDGYEAFNMHPNHNQSTAVAVAYAKKAGKLITGGTDFHHEGHEGCIAMMTKYIPEDSFGIASILKSGDFLFNLKGSIIIP